MARYLVAGLGNWGKQYENTPHNLGFAAVDRFIAQHKLDEPKLDERFKGTLTLTDQAILLKPTTFMNLSGQAVSLVANFYKIPVNQIVVIHDDAGLPLGDLKVSRGKGAGNHNGVTSIIGALGTNDFARIRLGIGQSETLPLESYVLIPFAAADKQTIDGTIDNATTALTMILKDGVSTAMNRYNQ